MEQQLYVLHLQPMKAQKVWDISEEVERKCSCGLGRIWRIGTLQNGGLCTCISTESGAGSGIHWYKQMKKMTRWSWN